MLQRMKVMCSIVWMLTGVFFCDIQAYATEATISHFEYTDNDGIVTIESYNGGSANVDLGVLFPDATEIIIGNQAFFESNITGITIPKTASSIGELAFFGCQNLQTVTFEERTTESITFAVGTFQGCNNLMGLDIPDTVTNIPSRFCYDCSALVSVELPKKCRTIGESAFESCPLVNITIPESCVSIDEMAFYDCTNLKGVTFENSDTEIGDNAFPSVEEAKNLVIYCEGEGSVTVYATTYNIQYAIIASSIMITQLPTQIEYFCGEESELDTDGMKIIVQYVEGTESRSQEVALEECTFSSFDANKVGEQIITVSYGGSKATFTVRVYYNIANVSVEVDETTYTGSRVQPYMTVIGNEEGTPLVLDKDYVVYYSDNLNSGTAKATITGIGNYKGSKTVQFKVLPKELTVANTKVMLADMNYTGQQLCPVPEVACDTKTLVLDKDYIVTYGTNVNVGKGTVIIEGIGNYTGTIKIGFNINPENIPQKGNTYPYKKMIYKVTGSNTVTFMKPVNKKTKKITIPSRVKILGNSFQVTKINKKACYNCKQLMTVTIGDKVTTIGDQAFAKCGKLKKVTIGKGLKKLGKKVFYQDKKLSLLTIKSSKLSKVGKGTLRGVKKVRIQAPKKKVEKYKKLFKKAK